MRRLHTPARRGRGGAAVGLTGTVLIHAALVGLLFLSVSTPKSFPPVYAVNLVAAPAPRPETRKAPEAVQRPVEEAPAPTRTTPKPTPSPAPVRRATPEKREPAPKQQAQQVTPAKGETPGTGNEVANIKTPGLEFPYPDYLTNIVSQIYRRWDRPLGPAVLRAEVSFYILRDGSVRDIRFVQSSGNFSFDLSCQGAIEAAKNAGAFGPLPDGYEADVLPVSFFFTPRVGQ